MDNRLDIFEKILKEHDQDLYMYFSPKNEIQLKDIDPRELFSKAIKWSNLSVQGLLCGMMGCSDDPTETCKMCGCTYCLLHIKWHFHTVNNNGIIEVDEKDTPN